MSPAQEWGEPPPSKVKLDIHYAREFLDELESKHIYVEELIELGKWLMDRLLPTGDLRQLFIHVLKNVGSDEGVRLRLVAHDLLLAQLPWEYCYLKIREGEDNLANFLVLNPRISLVRHQPVSTPMIELASIDPKNLRMLVVMSSPDSPELPPLNLAREREVLNQAIGNFNVDGVKILWQPVLENATTTRLDFSLLQKPSLFHYSGFGVVDPLDDTSSLVFIKDDPSLAADFLPTSSLAEKLQVAGVRLAYLGAQQYNRTRGIGVAQAFAASGISAVIGLQYGFFDDKAVLFTQALYMSIAVGLTIDEAVNMGRLSVLNQSGEDGIEWGVPVLYLRSPNGILFPELGQHISATGVKFRTSIDKIEKGGQFTGLKF